MIFKKTLYVCLSLINGCGSEPHEKWTYPLPVTTGFSRLKLLETVSRFQGERVAWNVLYVSCLHRLAWIFEHKAGKSKGIHPGIRLNGQLHIASLKVAFWHETQFSLRIICIGIMG